MFEQFYGKAEDLVLDKAAWCPIPDCQNRAVWDNIEPSRRKFYLQQAKELTGWDWPELPAVRYMDFFRDGNRTRYQQIYAKRRNALVYFAMAEAMENKGTYLDDLINGLWATMDEATWVGPAHNHMYPAVGIRRPLPIVYDPENVNLDHFSGDCGALVAVIYQLMKKPLDDAAPQVTQRMKHLLWLRIVQPFLTKDDYWWMGQGENGFVNNWLSWLVSNCLTAALLVFDEREIRVAVVEKALRLLDRFLSIYSPDGGCDEGPGYWGVACGAMMNALEIIKGVTGGRIDVFDQPLIRNINAYIYKMHINDEMYVNFADADAIVHIAAPRVYRMGKLIHDDNLVCQAVACRDDGNANAAFNREIGWCPFSGMMALLEYKAFAGEKKAKYPRLGSVWFPGIQVMCQRSKAGSSSGLYFAAKGGHNDESHNHNDVGNFVIYLNGKPAIIDIGSGEYVSQTFGPGRYQIKQIRSDYHNVPLINGVTQHEGKEFRAENVQHSDDGTVARLQMELQNAYPAESGISRWQREFTFDRTNRQVLVQDDFSLTKETDDVTLVIATHAKPLIDKKNHRVLIDVQGDTLVMEYDGTLTAKAQAYDISADTRLAKVWTDKVYRILLQADKPMQQGSFTLKFFQDER